MKFTRRSFINYTTSAGLAAQALQAQQPAQPQAPPPRRDQDPRAPSQDAAKLFRYSDQRSKVALFQGDNRRKLIFDALVAIDDQILPGLRQRKSVIIKPNAVNPSRQLASTHVDTIHAVLDYLGPRFKGPVTIAECCGNPNGAYEAFHWAETTSQHKPLDVRFVSLNDEPDSYKILNVIDYDLHPVPVRLAARLLDPDAFVISAGPIKTHNMAVATLSIKNMVLGAPLQSAPGQPRYNDKRKYHVGLRQSYLNMMTTAQFMKPNWGLAVLDGFEAMEGNGPGGGTPVDHKIAVASIDFLAADRVAIECMGIDASWVGYMNYLYQAGFGQYDLSKIDLIGLKTAAVQRKYQLHNDVERMLEWRGPMNEMPPNLGD